MSKIYNVTIKGCHIRIVVRAINKKEAEHRAWRLMEKIAPAKKQKENGWEPYYLKYFKAVDITKELEAGAYLP